MLQLPLHLPLQHKLTIQPAPAEPTNHIQSSVSSHRRLELEARFNHVSLDIIGLQETRTIFHGLVELRSTL